MSAFVFVFFFGGGVLCWVFVAEHGLSLVSVSRSYSSLQCTGFSLRRFPLWNTGSKAPASVVAARGLSSCGAWAFVALRHVEFLDQGSDLCPLHWQAHSYPLYHQSVIVPFLILGWNSILFSTATVCTILFSPTVHKGFNFSTPSPTLAISWIFDSSHPNFDLHLPND